MWVIGNTMGQRENKDYSQVFVTGVIQDSIHFSIEEGEWIKFDTKEEAEHWAELHFPPMMIPFLRYEEK